MPVSIVYINTGEPAEARRIGRVLVEEKLAASVNIVERIASVYRWDGAVRESDEAQMLVKTRTDLVDAVIDRVGELHGYACPCILAVPVSGGNPDYLAWVERETQGA